MFVYKITNQINKKCYIGSTKDPKKRWQQHKNSSVWESCPSYNYPLQKAMRKYGIDNFSFEILEELKTVEELDQREQYYIKFYNTITPNGYNILEGGQKNRRAIEYCKNCGEPLKYSKTGYCVKCKNIPQYKCEHPSKEQLNILIHEKSFCEIGRMFNVSDNAVRKWCIKYGLPHKKKNLKIN